ncbi:MAG: hypothetical protein J0H66_00750 [Solirubrobacterales bacterium]|mgnify:CR=1 FL=1|nr:hypothetical protein [Solirubrobacterales bacterium]OJU94316.1 MAG: hypothetical protein BGO23_02580 [Solirubrobacterales bacterium 67-14]
MLGDEVALEQLRQCERDLQAYADERGLTLRTDPAFPGAQPPEEQIGPVKHAVWSLVGEMPGGAVARLRHQAIFGEMIGVDVAGHHTVMVTRLPQTVGLVPMLSLRPDEFGAGLFQWTGDGRARQEQTFESLELERRYLIEVAKGQDQQWLYRLFTPTLIDWLASSTPPDFAFRLSSGSFGCEAPQWRGQYRADGQVDSDHLDLLAESGGKVAGRLRDEVLEQVGLGHVPAARSGDANADWTGKKKRGLLGFVSRALAGKDDSVREFTEPRGFVPVDPSAFHMAHLELPLPAAADQVFEGRLADGREVNLAWMEYENEIDGLRYYVALVSPIKGPGAAGMNFWLDDQELLASEDPPGIDADLAQKARGAGLGLSTGGGAICVYVSSDGWSGRIPGLDIDRMIEAAPAIFNAADRQASQRD